MFHQHPNKSIIFSAIRDKVLDVGWSFMENEFSGEN